MENLLKGGYMQGGADRTLFTRKSQKRVITLQIFVGDIVFGSTFQHLVEKFVRHMSTKFENSLVGELT